VSDATERTASIYTLGCRLNQSESAVLEERLTAAGYRIVPFGDPADLAIIHTCTVTGEADAKSRKAIRAFVRKHPGAFLAVIGCYAELSSVLLAEMDGVDLIVGNRRKLDVLDYVHGEKNPAPVVVRDDLETGPFSINARGHTPVTRRANLKIQDGCDCRCSYCLVPQARGRARSRRMDDLLADAARLVERGAKEIVLTGVNVAAYAYEGRTLADVVDRLNDLDGLTRLRISSIELTPVLEALLGPMADPGHALVPFLHLPLQSGSDVVLTRMNRTCTAAAFADFVQRAADQVEGLCVGTDVLVGFPGETAADFEASCRLVRDLPIAYAHVFKYSARPGTPAADLPGRLPPPVLKARSETVRRISAEKRQAFHEGQVGAVREVLFESKRGGHWFGYTGNYVRVGVRFIEDDLSNRVRRVLLEEVRGPYVMGSVKNDG